MSDELRKRLPRSFALFEQLLHLAPEDWAPIDRHLHNEFMKVAATRMLYIRNRREPLSKKAIANYNWMVKNPHKVAAHSAVESLKYRGLTPQPCVDCGEIEKTEGHHEDYGRPNEVVWLCHSCHAKRHAEAA